MLSKDKKGDTIVEVLIALAVLSLAFAISYATANSAIINSQNTQEHTLALQYIDSQIEKLRFVATNPQQNIVPSAEFNATNTSNDSFCLYFNSLKTDLLMSNSFNLPTFTKYGQINSSLSFPSACKISGGGFNYYVAITPVANNSSTFNITAWWTGLGKLGNQSEALSYRVYLQ